MTQFTGASSFIVRVVVVLVVAAAVAVSVLIIIVFVKKCNLLLLLLLLLLVSARGTKARTTRTIQQAPVKLIMLWNPVNCINTPGRFRNARGQGRTVPRAPHGPTTQM